MFQKSFNGEPTLFLVSTPIGNLEDITLRAINILKEVSFVFAEDTRVSKKLLNHLGIDVKLYSAYDQVENKSALKIISFLKEGNSVALISDAGTPLINDPGYKIVRQVIDSGFNVVAIPGVAAFLPALITSGIAPYPFFFFGFLSNKEGKRISELKELSDIKNTLVFYETPHRIEKSLRNMIDIFGDREISISREITKKFEEVFRGKISKYLNEDKVIKGEYVIVVSGKFEEDEINEVALVQDLLENGFSKKEAILKISKEYNLPKNDLYEKVHKKGE